MNAPVREGDVLAGKYRVERLLGQGGMGVVVAARHVELDDLVALKFLLPEALSNPDAVSRFLNEARASVRIRSEHIARVHDVGELESGAPYIVMEYLDGSDLAAVLRHRGSCSIEDAVDYLAQACEAMAGAHVTGIVHRDLKPSNLMLVLRSDGSECVKVLDFGISKILHGAHTSSSSRMTRSLALLGSPSYMSPEQMMSTRDIDGRTDIWALGAILYELLTGRLPFEGETLPAISVMIATQEPTPMGQLRPDVPPALEAVVLRCLAKRPEQRFANAGELAMALLPFAPPRAHLPIERASRIASSSGVRRPPEPLGMGPHPGGGGETPVDAGARRTPGRRPVGPAFDLRSNHTLTATPNHPPPTALSSPSLALPRKRGGAIAAVAIGLAAAFALTLVLVLHRGSETPAPASLIAPPPVVAPMTAPLPATPPAVAAPPQVSPEVGVEHVTPGAVEAGVPSFAASPRPGRPVEAPARASPGRVPSPTPAAPKKSAYDDM
jgi:serine/threonine protein kinase